MLKDKKKWAVRKTLVSQVSRYKTSFAIVRSECLEWRLLAI